MWYVGVELLEGKFDGPQVSNEMPRSSYLITTTYLHVCVEICCIQGWPSAREGYSTGKCLRVGAKVPNACLQHLEQVEKG